MNHPIRPYSEEDFQHPFDSESQVVSSTECTGMIPSAATEEEEIDSYHSIYDVPLEEDSYPQNQHQYPKR